MAQPKWLIKYLTMKPEVNKIYEDLDRFRTFCVDYGYVYNEADLYNERAVAYGEFLRLERGKWARDQWRDGTKPKFERKEWKPRNPRFAGGRNA
jgi:hypothetical protein